MFNNTYEYSWLRLGVLGKGDMEKITLVICGTCCGRSLAMYGPSHMCSWWAEDED